MELSTLAYRNATAEPAAVGRRTYLCSDDELISWQRQAACRGVSPSVFFAVEQAEDSYLDRAGEGAALDDLAAEADLLAEVDEAKAVCARCAVQMECLEYALMMREKRGVWGGKSARERSQLIRSRQRAAARRRRTAVASGGGEAAAG